MEFLKHRSVYSLRELGVPYAAAGVGVMGLLNQIAPACSVFALFTAVFGRHKANWAGLMTSPIITVRLPNIFP